MIFEKPVVEAFFVRGASRVTFVPSWEVVARRPVLALVFRYLPGGVAVVDIDGEDENRRRRRRFPGGFVDAGTDAGDGISAEDEECEAAAENEQNLDQESPEGGSFEEESFDEESSEEEGIEEQRQKGGSRGTTNILAENISRGMGVQN